MWKVNELVLLAFILPTVAKCQMSSWHIIIGGGDQLKIYRQADLLGLKLISQQM